MPENPKAGGARCTCHARAFVAATRQRASAGDVSGAPRGAAGLAAAIGGGKSVSTRRACRSCILVYHIHAIPCMEIAAADHIALRCSDGEGWVLRY